MGRVTSVLRWGRLSFLFKFLLFINIDGQHVLGHNQPCILFQRLPPVASNCYFLLPSHVLMFSPTSAKNCHSVVVHKEKLPFNQLLQVFSLFTMYTHVIHLCDHIKTLSSVICPPIITKKKKNLFQLIKVFLPAIPCQVIMVPFLL